MVNNNDNGHTLTQPRYSLRSLLTFNPLRLPSTRIDHKYKSEHKDAHVVEYLGQDLLYHEYNKGGRHLTPDELEPYRMVGDPVLDDLLEYMDQEGHPLRPGDDLLAAATIVKTNSNPANKTSVAYPTHIQDRVDAFVNVHTEIPSWVDANQLARGQSVFLCFVPAMGISLYYRSFCAGFSIPKIAAVVTATGYLAPPSTPEQVTLRMIDTGALLNACMGHGGVDSILTPGVGEGWKTCLHVRILHAKVRRTLLRRKGKRAWKTNEYGIPINQEDMAATLLAFSINTLVGAEFVGGVTLSRQEQDDYMALWRYMGWLLGVDTAMCDDAGGDAAVEPSSGETTSTTTTQLKYLDPCGPGWDKTRPDPIDHAKCMLQSMIMHLMKPDQSSVTVARHLLKIGRPQRKDKNNDKFPDKKKKKQTLSNNEGLWFYFRALACRCFIGNPLADALELPRHPQLHVRMFLQCCLFLYMWIFRILTWMSMWDFAGKRFEKYYLRTMGKFHDIWTERHTTRMAESLQVKSSCPFAMVTKED